MTAPADWPSWQPVADQVRRITATMLDSAMSSDDMDQAAAMLADINAFLATRAGKEPALSQSFDSGRPLRDPAHNFRRRSLVASAEHPHAAPLAFTVNEAGVAIGRVTLGRAYQDVPGFCDDSYVGLLFDNLFGVAGGWALPGPFFTKTLSVTRHRPVPLHRELEIRTWVDRTEGRKAFLSGELACDSEVLAQSTALMVMPKEFVG